jgi:hypothetical protein
LIIFGAAACSKMSEPPVTAKVDRIRVRPTGSVYVHLSVTNNGDTAL